MDQLRAFKTVVPGALGSSEALWGFLNRGANYVACRLHLLSPCLPLVCWIFGATAYNFMGQKVSEDEINLEMHGLADC